MTTGKGKIMKSVAIHFLSAIDICLIVFYLTFLPFRITTSGEPAAIKALLVLCSLLLSLASFIRYKVVRTYR